MLITLLSSVVLAQVPTVALAGTVTGPAGKPVIGAELILAGLPSNDPPILARVKSDEQGRFSLDRPITLAGEDRPQQVAILWVVKPRFRLSATHFTGPLPGPGEPLRIVMEPPGGAEVRVQGPDGQPLRGVKVLPQWLKTHSTTIPDVVADLSAATTGPDGLAVFDAAPPGELTYVDVHSREFGIQGRPIATKPGKPAVVGLRPVSTWKGRLSAKDPNHALGWRVRAYTRVEPPDFGAEPQTTGFVETKTDHEGRFALAPIAIGGLQLDLKPPDNITVVPDLPTALMVREGRVESVEIPLKATVTVTGLFLERGTGKPVPGVSATLIYLGNRNGSRYVKTDERGRYTFQSLPGLVRVGHFSFPPTHVMAPGQGWEDFTVPEPPKVIELATREALTAAPPLRGQVVDEAGKTVPGASVQASWILTGANGSSDGSISTYADGGGRFVLEGLGPRSMVSITADSHGRRSKSPLKVRAGEAGEATIAIAEVPVFAVAGRVLGCNGTPVAGIPVRLQFRVPRDNFPGFPEQPRFTGNPEIKTAVDGSFKTPKELERKPSEYRIEVFAEGFLPGRTPWTAVPDGDLLALPDLTLKRSRGVRIVSGRVVDRDGRPIPGATVAQAGDGPRWTSAGTDADGRFRLPGVAGGAALVFAQAPGFRFGGTIVGDGVEPVEIRPALASEPPSVSLKTLPPPPPKAEERALARALLEPMMSPAGSIELGNYRSSLLPALARVDPARVLSMIENRAVADLSGTLTQVALGQYEDSPAQAIATLEDNSDAASRAEGWLALEAYRPSPDRARREDLLKRALADARSVAMGDVKVRLFGQIADRWLDFGSVARARPILLEGQGILASWPRGRWFFEVEGFAEVLAAVDLPAATALFERRGWSNVSTTDAASINRHRGEAAVRLARIDPAEAERLIAEASADFYDRPAIVLQAARNMARVDLPRARRLIETLNDAANAGQPANPALVPFGLGVLAGELADGDAVQARGLLDEAYSGLRSLAVQNGSGQRQDSVSNLMAELLPTTERLQSNRLAERTWLAAASRAPMAQEPKGEDLQGIFALAMLVARYDRAMADVIASEALQRLPDLLGEPDLSFGFVLSTIGKTLGAYDPRTIPPLLRVLPDVERKPSPGPETWTAPGIKAQLRLAVAQILGFPFEARAREAGRVGNVYLPYRLGD